jgi:hypothetical protein
MHHAITLYYSSYIGHDTNSSADQVAIPLEQLPKLDGVCHECLARSHLCERALQSMLPLHHGAAPTAAAALQHSSTAGTLLPLCLGAAVGGRGLSRAPCCVHQLCECLYAVAVRQAVAVSSETSLA